MPVLSDYAEFSGLHWETGTVRNFYANRGVKAPHTGEPYSEAFLMGVSGGIVMGYFSFAYEGYDPMARILTRNTFDPLNTMLERLGVVQNIEQTSIPQKARESLVEILENGIPAIVWADMFTMPYNAMLYDESMWGMVPVVVFGYDKDQDQVWIADRARVPLIITTNELATVRGRVKKFKHRLMTLEPPNPDKLGTAVRKGLWDTVKLFTEAPPKGTKNNFGFAAYRWWADLLTKPKQRMSWEREFPAGVKMYAGLMSAYSDICLFGKDGGADRDAFADFLDEASLILDEPSMKEVSPKFRASGRAWDELANALLPDEVQQFKETRELMSRRHSAFLAEGGRALPEIREIDSRLKQIRAEVEAGFPLDDARVVSMREKLAEKIMKIHDIEEDAIRRLQEVLV